MNRFSLTPHKTTRPNATLTRRSHARPILQDHQEATLQDRWTIKQDTVNEQNLYSDDDICFMEDQDDDFDSPQSIAISRLQQQKEDILKRLVEQANIVNQLDHSSNNDQFFQIMKKYSEHRSQTLQQLCNIGMGEKIGQFQRNLQQITDRIDKLRQINNCLPLSINGPCQPARLSAQSKLQRLQELNQSYCAKLDQMGGKSELRDKTNKTVNFNETISLKTFGIGEEVTLMNEKEQEKEEINLAQKIPLLKYQKAVTQSIKLIADPHPQRQVKKIEVDAGLVSLTKCQEKGNHVPEAEKERQQFVLNQQQTLMRMQEQMLNR